MIDNQTPAPAFDYRGCITGLVENGAFALGMLLMFSKTVDLMTAFAPTTLFGYTGVETFYGLAVGILIEGALFVMKLTLSRAKNVMDWFWNVLVVLAPFIISALAQVFDSFLTRDTLATQPQSVQVFVTWFVPSIPTLIMALLIGKSIFGSIPTELIPRGSPVSQVKYGKPVTPVVGRFVFKLPKFLQRSKKVEPENPTPAAPEPTSVQETKKPASR